MNIARTQSTDHRKTVATNVSLDASLVAEARELGINISRASASGLRNAIACVRAERWLLENGSALESSNAFADSNGLPLARLRQF